MRCDDAISRQAVLDALYELCDTGETLIENPWRDNPHIDALVDTIEQLPPVNPQEPKTDVLDKIMAEIEQMNNIDYVEPITVDEVLQIIDKYKAESEVQHDTISVRQNDS